MHPVYYSIGIAVVLIIAFFLVWGGKCPKCGSRKTRVKFHESTNRPGMVSISKLRSCMACRETTFIATRTNRQGSIESGDILG
jgi:hypothetical protein